MLLADRTVLLLDADGALLTQLGSELKRHGARCFLARDAATASFGARETLPDAMVCGLELPGVDTVSLVAELRSAPESTALPVVALLSADQASTSASPMACAGAESGFQKCLPKPVNMPDLVDALCCVLGDRTRPVLGSVPSAELIDELIVQHDFRRLLALLNASTAHRYSALFRREGAELQSVWTFDRERPESDPIAQRLPIDATPCATLFATKCSHAVDDAACDPNIAPAQRHSLMRSFVGTPLVGLDALIFGALCHFSPEPRRRDEQALDRLQRVAQVLSHGERRRRPR
jgi:DNA-binding response OmpR family regulator